MDERELDDILAAHRKWLNDEGGKRAHLSGADLRCADHGETADATDEPSEGGEQPAPERAIDEEGLAALARDVKRESETKGYMSCAYFGAELNGTATCVACPAKDGGGECRRDVALDILRRLRACGVLPATDADTTVETSDAPEGGDAE